MTEARTMAEDWSCRGQAALYERERASIMIESGVPEDRARAVAACERRIAEVGHRVWRTEGCRCGAHGRGTR